MKIPEKFNNPYYREREVKNGDYTAFHIPQAIEDYFDFHERIKHEKDTAKKLSYCHMQVKLLPFFIFDMKRSGCKTAPQSVACRDTAPKLYMRMGKWREARNFIEQCIEADAYYPETGEKELEYLEKYKETAEITLKYLRDNPGTLQKDIYKIIGKDVPDVAILKQFIRWSELVYKKPSGKTNLLFAFLSDMEAYEAK